MESVYGEHHRFRLVSKAAFQINNAAVLWLAFKVIGSIGPSFYLGDQDSESFSRNSGSRVYLCVSSKIPRLCKSQWPFSRKLFLPNNLLLMSVAHFMNVNRLLA